MQIRKYILWVQDFKKKVPKLQADTAGLQSEA